MIKTFKSFDYETVSAIKYGLMMALIIDIFGIYWYLEWKQLSVALMLVIAIFIVIFLLLERRLEDNMCDSKETSMDSEILEKEKELEELKKKKNQDTETKEDTSNKDNKKIGLGLPNTEDYQKRMEGALGKPLF